VSFVERVDTKVADIAVSKQIIQGLDSISTLFCENNNSTSDQPCDSSMLTVNVWRQWNRDLWVFFLLEQQEHIKPDQANSRENLSSDHIVVFSLEALRVTNCKVSTNLT